MFNVQISGIGLPEARFSVFQTRIEQGLLEHGGGRTPIQWKLLKYLCSTNFIRVAHCLHHVLLVSKKTATTAKSIIIIVQPWKTCRPVVQTENYVEGGKGFPENHAHLKEHLFIIGKYPCICLLLNQNYEIHSYLAFIQILFFQLSLYPGCSCMPYIIFIHSIL